MLTAFFEGFILALGLIIPLGVQNIFVFNQGASQRKFFSALPSVFTAAFCDTVLIAFAVLGVSLVLLEIVWLKIVLLVVGFFFLLFMGWRTWNTPGNAQEEAAEPLQPRHQIAFAASVSLLNPHAVLDTIGVIGPASASLESSAKWSFALAAISVSFIWFFGLAIAGRTLRTFDQSGTTLTRVNKISALIIWGVAFYILFQLIK